MAVSSTQRLPALLNLIGLAGVLTMNILANALPLNGVNTGEISARYPNLFVPAGLTFSIWGLIYLLLVLFVLYPLRAMIRDDRRGEEILRATGPWFLITCLANMSWIWTWHHGAPGLSLIFMVILLVALVALYLRLQVSRRLVRPLEKLAIQAPVSIYLGWICVATIANVTAVLVNAGWQGGAIGEAGWAILMIVVAGSIGGIFLYRRGDLLFSATLCWALLGILLRRQDEGGRWDTVGLTAALVLVLLVVAAGLRARKDYA
jgi:translocator protein